MKLQNRNTDKLTEELNELKLKIAKMNARRNAQINLLKKDIGKRYGISNKSQYLYPYFYYDDPRYRYSYLYPRYHSLDNLLSSKYYENKPFKKAVAFTSDRAEGNLKSNAHSSSMSDLLAKLKDFVFEQEKQLTDDLLNKISRSRQMDSVLRSTSSRNSLKDLSNYAPSDPASNSVDENDKLFYKRYKALAKRVSEPLSTFSTRNNTYKPWFGTRRLWYDSDDYYDHLYDVPRWARWYQRYLTSPLHHRYPSDFNYYTPRVYPISLPSDVKSLVKDKTRYTDSEKFYPSEIKSSRNKYDPFESDTYLRSRLPSWKQYYYTQKLRSKPSNESYLQYYDPYYDFFPDVASADSTDELIENVSPVSPVKDEFPNDTNQLIDDYRDAIYEDIIQNLRTRQQRPAANTFPRRKPTRFRKALSPTFSSERVYTDKLLDNGDVPERTKYNSVAFASTKKYNTPTRSELPEKTNLAYQYTNTARDVPAYTRQPEKYEISEFSDDCKENPVTEVSKKLDHNSVMRNPRNKPFAYTGYREDDRNATTFAKDPQENGPNSEEISARIAREVRKSYDFNSIPEKPLLRPHGGNTTVSREKLQESAPSALVRAPLYHANDPSFQDVTNDERISTFVSREPNIKDISEAGSTSLKNANYPPLDENYEAASVPELFDYVDGNRQNSRPLMSTPVFEQNVSSTRRTSFQPPLERTNHSMGPDQATGLALERNRKLSSAPNVDHEPDSPLNSDRRTAHPPLGRQNSKLTLATRVDQNLNLAVNSNRGNAPLTERRNSKLILAPNLDQDPDASMNSNRRTAPPIGRRNSKLILAPNIEKNPDSSMNSNRRPAPPIGRQNSRLTLAPNLDQGANSSSLNINRGAVPPIGRRNSKPTFPANLDQGSNLPSSDLNNGADPSTRERNTQLTLRKDVEQERPQDLNRRSEFTLGRRDSKLTFASGVGQKPNSSLDTSRETLHGVGRRDSNLASATDIGQGVNSSPSLDTSLTSAIDRERGLDSAVDPSQVAISLRRRDSNNLTSVAGDKEKGLDMPSKDLSRRDSNLTLGTGIEQSPDSSLSLNPLTASSLRRKNSEKLISPPDVTQGQDLSFDLNRDMSEKPTRRTLSRSDSSEPNKKLDTNLQPHPEYGNGLYHHTADYDRDNVDEGDGEPYRNTDFSQPIYEQYEGNHPDYYYNNNYQVSRYDADRGYVEDDVRPDGGTVSLANYDENAYNAGYEQYEQPGYYGNESSNNENFPVAAYDPNIASTDAYYPRGESYQHANYMINGDPENYTGDYEGSYSMNSAGNEYYQQDTTFPATEYINPDRDRDTAPPSENIEPKKIEPTEMLENHVPVSSLEDGEPAEQLSASVAEFERDENEEDAARKPYNSQSLEVTNNVIESDNPPDRKTSTENNEGKIREPISSRRASKIALQSSSDDIRKSNKVQPLANDSQKRASKTKLGESKLKRTASTVNKSKTPISKRT